MTDKKNIENKILTNEDIVKEKNTELLIKRKKDKQRRNNWLNDPSNKSILETNPNLEILFKLPISDKLRIQLLKNKDFF
jgi:hypothetical protein